MDPNTIGQIILIGLQIFKTILDDIPKERRVQAWVEFFAWVDEVSNLGSTEPKTKPARFAILSGRLTPLTVAVPNTATA